MTGRLFLLSSLFLLMVSCDQIRSKSKEAVRSAKREVKRELHQQIENAMDKVAPSFDSNQADTKNNKKHFKDFIKVELTPDVKNIYCFDDAIGINADYMFAFNCADSTSEKIIKRHRFIKDTLKLDASGLQHDFPWWNKTEIKKLEKYSWTNGKQYYKYYWYDHKLQKAYFFDFDM